MSGVAAREDVAALVVRHADGFRRRDPAALAADHAIDGIVVSPMFATVRGRPAIEESYRALFTAFPDWRLTVEETVIDGNKAAAVFRATATHVNEFFGLPGTHKRFEIHGVLFVIAENGLIAHEQRIYDFTGLLIQVGVLRAKPAKP